MSKIFSYKSLNTINSIEKYSQKSENLYYNREYYISYIENIFFSKFSKTTYLDILSYINLYNIEDIYNLYQNIDDSFDYGIFSHLFILDIISNYKQFDNDINYATIFWADTLFYYFDLINLKILYVESNEKEKYYLSPLNNRKFRTLITKIKIYDDLYYEKINNKLISILKEFKDDKYILFDTNNYDLVIFLSHYDYINLNHEIELINFNKQKDFISCIMKSNNSFDNISHMISISKCYNNYILHTTWNEKNTKKVNNFIPFKNKDFILKNNSYLSTLKSDNKNYYIYNTQLHSYNNILYIFDNIYFFSCKINKKIYKSINGGNIFGSEKYNINDEKCLNIMNTVNNFGFCWLSSIINSLCYSDNLSYIIYKKSERFIKKIIIYIQNFIQNKYYKDKDLDIILCHNYYHILSLYIHSSYYLLKTQRIDNEELKKFSKKIELFNDNSIFIILYSYIINLYIKI